MHDIDIVLKVLALFIPCFSIFLIFILLNRCSPRQSSETRLTDEDQLPVYSGPPPPEYKLEDF